MSDDGIVPLICPTCQNVFERSLKATGYFAWGCFRYFGLGGGSAARLRPMGFGVAAFARFASEVCGLPSRSSRAAPAFARVGFGAAAFSRFASEGWWGKKDSNLRSRKTADLQSAPFATRDTPPFNSIANPAAWRRHLRPWMTLIP
jgi:hypothetical protein